PRAMALPALRAARALSQQKLASVLGVKQAQISKLERQVNMRLGTLRKFVRALGGQLEIRARFKDESGDVIIAGPWAGAGTSAEDEDSTSGTPAARQKRRKPGKQRGGPGSSRRRR
ncbi:MAG TPA: XRE family transcriptional regulator, partial [Spirochaetia bacterium]